MVSTVQGAALLSDEHSDGCKIAFLAVLFLNGRISYDTGTWEDIGSEVQRLKHSCQGSSGAFVGGNLVVGGSVDYSENLHGLLWFAQVIILGLP